MRMQSGDPQQLESATTRPIERGHWQPFASSIIPAEANETRNLNLSISPLNVTVPQDGTAMFRLSIPFGLLGCNLTDWDSSINGTSGAQHWKAEVTQEGLEVHIPPDAEPGYYQISIAALVTEGGSCPFSGRATAQALFEVTGFSVRVWPRSVEVRAGDNATFAVVVAHHGRDRFPVRLSVIGLPQGIESRFDGILNGPPRSPPFIANLTLSVDTTVAARSYELEVVGSWDGPRGEVKEVKDRVTLTVTPSVTLTVTASGVSSEPNESLRLWLAWALVVVVGLAFGLLALVVDMRSTVRVRSVVPSPVVSAPPRAQTLSSVCPRCKRSSRAGAKFCTHCGGPLSSRAPG
jgi:hypothetical protein